MTTRMMTTGANAWAIERRSRRSRMTIRVMTTTTRTTRRTRTTTNAGEDGGRARAFARAREGIERGREMIARASTEGEDEQSDRAVPFGYTRLDVMLIGGGLTAMGFGTYAALQRFGGMDAARAGNAVQLTFVLGLTLVWVGSYVLRVFNKDMTYAKQLRDYEDAVMQKRLEEMPEAELNKMMESLKDDK